MPLLTVDNRDRADPVQLELALKPMVGEEQRRAGRKVVDGVVGTNDVVLSTAKTADAGETGAGASGVGENERKQNGMWLVDINTRGKHGVGTGSGDWASEV
ncbi:hypothetical protein B0H13DRAFT_1850499 [Mycena leptocephala]|nr:hypothetical protein B0H13DRAFT_1850499 [Mycena leptocephala]